MSFKKVLLLFGVSCFFAVSAQETGTSQILVPREVYIGDTAEIQYTFDSASVFPLGERGILHLKFPESLLTPMQDVCSVKDVILTGKEHRYILTITVVPWRTGTIDFPPFDLLSLIDSNSSGAVIDLKPFSVSSIIDKTGNTGLHAPYPPFLIPGTTYVVYGTAVLLLICIGLLIRFLLNMQKVTGSVRKLILRIRYGRNARMALRRLRLLRKDAAGGNLDDESFCARLQSVTRIYLEYRFGYPFTTVTASCFERTFDSITGGTLSSDQMQRIEELGNLFRRTDYIRYAHGSLDADKLYSGTGASGHLSDTKRSSLVDAVCSAVLFFERKDTGDAEGGDRDA